MSVCASLLAATMPDLGEEKRAAARATGHLGVWTVISAHRRVLATLGTAVVILGMSRSLRLSLLPLWADHVGLSASTTSLIFAGAAALDVAFMWPGGWLMDTRGRMVVAVPVVLSMAVACLLLPLATDAVSVALVMALIACGNGLGSGIVMTLGADAAPADGSSQFLGAWRLCGDIGNTGGPLLVSAVAAVAPLAVACLDRRRARTGRGRLGRLLDQARGPGPGGGRSADGDRHLVGHDVGSVSTTRNSLGPVRLVWTYVAKVPPLTDMVTGKSDHAPFSIRCTCRMAPSPAW